MPALKASLIGWRAQNGSQDEMWNKLKDFDTGSVTDSTAAKKSD